MRKMLARLALAAGFVVTTLAAAAPALAQKTIRVGVIQPLSGNQATYGRETQPVVEYLVKRINAEGGIKSMGGAKLELVLADTSSQSGQAAREAVRLITQEKVDVMVGALLSNDMLAVTQAVDEHHMPTISFFAGASRSTYAYTVGFAYDEGYAASMANLIADLRATGAIPVERVVLAYANYEGGQQINKYLKDRLTAMGVKVLSEVALDVKGQDFMAPLLKIKSEKPDAVVGLMLQNQIIGIMRSRHQIKYYDSIFIGSLANADIRLRRDLGPEVANEVLPQGVFGMALYSPDAKIPAVQTLADQLLNEAKMGESFGQLSIPAAQGIRVLQRALEAAGTTDPEVLAEAIGKVRIPFGAPDLYFPLPNGLSFNAERVVPNLTSMMAQWSPAPDTHPVIVFPAAVASAKPRR